MIISQSIQDRVYTTLRRSILNLELAPGTAMSTQELARRMEVSRTPVREAFIRLQRDGLVRILPQRETVVSLIDMGRVRQERFVRTNLELAAVEEFTRQRDQEQLDILNELLQKQVQMSIREEYEELIAADNAFHRQFFVGAGQRFSWELMEQSSTHYYRVRLLHIRVKGAVERIVFQHQELIHTVEQGKVQEARELLRRHLFQLDEEEAQLRERYPDYFLPAAVGMW